MVTINLKGREIPLVYTVYEMKQIQDEIGPLSQAIDTILGRNPENKEDMSRFGGADQIGAVAKAIRILGNAGLEEAGKEPDLTDKQVMRALKPGELLGTINNLMDAMNEGMRSEIPEKAEEGPVDVVLEEMKKKDVKGG